MENKLYAKKNIVLLLLGRTVSQFGSAFYLIALPLYILQITGSLAQSGLFFSLSSLPPLLITPFLGVLVEKANRKYLMAGCDLLTAALYAALLPLGDMFLPVLFVVTMLTNLVSRTFDIASKLMFTELTTPETIERYNGAKSFADNAAAVIAPSLGTIAFGLWGFRFVVIMVAAAYALSALQECFIVYRKTDVQTANEKKHVFAQLWDGLRYVAGQRDVRVLFLLAMALNFFVANAEEIINPGIIVQKYQISESLYGMTTSAAVIGTLIAGLFIFRNKRIDLRGNLRNLFLLNSGIMALTGAASLVMTGVPRVYFLLFLAAEFVIGFITSCVNVPLISSFQTSVPLEYQGRFFALLSFTSGLLIPLGISYTGFLASLVGADMAYIINNLVVIAIVLLCGKHI
ncbi:MAG: MFS transporter [Oscillibacter sp.]|nr:MFS transporter [Oscillibacter sp.]